MVSFKSALLSFVLLAGTTSLSSAFTVHPKNGPSPTVATVTGASTVRTISSSSSSTTTSLYMGWGPDPIWTGSEIESIQIGNLSKESSRVSVSVAPETAVEYGIPGQYVQVRQKEDAKPLFLVISSPPDKENARFEFLIKKTDDNTWISDREASGDGNIEVSQVLGSGFAMKEEFEDIKKYDFPCQNILLFAAGSGIAAIRAAIESGDLKTSGSRTARLYYGVRTEKDLCFVDRFPEWEKAGVEVVPVLSQPSESWKGRTGYVQNALEEDGVPVPRNTGALMCGMKGMAEAVTDVLSKAGVFEGRILTNF